MSRDSRFDHTMSRRSLILGLGQLTIGALLMGRLVYLQGFERKKYLMQAEGNRISFRFIPPQRGVFLDRYGHALADNAKFFRLVIIPEGVKDIPLTLEKGIALLDDPRPEVSHVLAAMKKKTKLYPTVIKENLSWDEVSRLALHQPDLPGLTVEDTWQRVYRYPESTSHVLGYIGLPAAEGLSTEAHPFLKHPDARMGKSGLEKVYNDTLQGRPGARHVEVNARGRVVKDLKRDAPLQGLKVRTTLDAGLQELIKDLLKPHKSGSVVVIEIPSGAVRAMVSVPSFDGNVFTQGISKKLWADLMADEQRPLMNKAIQGVYAPASTFKVITALAALTHGIVTPSTRFHCPGHMYYGNHKFHCVKKEGHGWMDLHTGLEKSCDVYFYELGRRLDIDKLASVASALGLGHITGIDLPAEQSGLMPTRDWKRRARKQPWMGGESVIAAIGQGYVLTTPLQLAVMIARLASGQVVTPFLVTPQGSPGTPLPHIDPHHIALIQDALLSAVNNPGGTGWHHRLPWDNWQMAGKTGTAQVRRITSEERRLGLVKSDNWAWHLRDNGLFAGYAPAHDPRFAVSVVVEHGGFGGVVAAPIAQAIMRYLKEAPQ